MLNTICIKILSIQSFGFVPKLLVLKIANFAISLPDDYFPGTMIWLDNDSKLYAGYVSSSNNPAYNNFDVSSTGISWYASCATATGDLSRKQYNGSGTQYRYVCLG
jgi:hypothetical protein